MFTQLLPTSVTYTLENCKDFYYDYKLTAVTDKNETLVSPVIGENNPRRINEPINMPVHLRVMLKEIS